MIGDLNALVGLLIALLTLGINIRNITTKRLSYVVNIRNGGYGSFDFIKHYRIPLVFNILIVVIFSAFTSFCVGVSFYGSYLYLKRNHDYNNHIRKYKEIINEKDAEMKKMLERSRSALKAEFTLKVEFTGLLLIFSSIIIIILSLFINSYSIANEYKSVVLVHPNSYEVTDFTSYYEISFEDAKKNDDVNVNSESDDILKYDLNEVFSKVGLNTFNGNYIYEEYLVFLSIKLIMFENNFILGSWYKYMLVVTLLYTLLEVVKLILKYNKILLRLHKPAYKFFEIFINIKDEYKKSNELSSDEVIVDISFYKDQVLIKTEKINDRFSVDECVEECKIYFYPKEAILNYGDVVRFESCGGGQNL